jgi:hypothetical protein
LTIKNAVETFDEIDLSNYEDVTVDYMRSAYNAARKCNIGNHLSKGGENEVLGALTLPFIEQFPTIGKTLAGCITRQRFKGEELVVKYANAIRLRNIYGLKTDISFIDNVKRVSCSLNDPLKSIQSVMLNGWCVRDVFEDYGSDECYHRPRSTYEGILNVMFDRTGKKHLIAELMNELVEHTRSD